MFKSRYALRSGIESTNSGLKNRLGLGRLRVRGRGSVFRVILHKITGWNVLRAATSEKLRARVRAEVTRTLKFDKFERTGQFEVAVSRLWDDFGMVSGASQGFGDLLAA